MNENKSPLSVLLLIALVLTGAAAMLLSSSERHYDELSIRYDTVASPTDLRSAVGDGIILPEISAAELETFEASVGYRSDERTSDGFVALNAHYFFPDETHCELTVDAKKGEVFSTHTPDISAP